MPVGIVYIEKELRGQKWENSYPFKVGGSTGLPTDETMTTLGASFGFTANNTSTLHVDFPEVTPNFLQSLIAYERFIHNAGVTITKLYVSDGSKNSSITDIGPLHSVFATVNLGFPCLNTRWPSNQTAPANVALRVLKNPSGFSQKSSYLAYLGFQDIGWQGADSVGFQDATQEAAVKAWWLTGYTDSFFFNFLGDGAGDVYTGQGWHSNINIGVVDVGDLLDVRKCSNYAVYQPFSRQVKRGKKRT
jgi:hypothetical protein